MPRPVRLTDSSSAAKSTGVSERRSTTSSRRPSSSAAAAASRQDLDHRPVGDQRGVGTGPDDPRVVQAQVGGLADLALVPVAALGLQEDHRVVRLDGLAQHPVRVVRVGRGDHPQTGGVGEVRLVRLAVVLDRADATRVGDAHGDRHLDVAQCAGVHLGQLGDDLVEGRVDEAVELDLHDRAVAAQREADRGADDAGLGERGVDHPVLAEVLLQAVGDPEDAAELADVLAHQDGLRVALQRLAQRPVERLGDAELAGHQWFSPASKEAAYSMYSARSSSTSACGSA